jgi:tetratricopeptide (TPR) repeat protein
VPAHPFGAFSEVAGATPAERIAALSNHGFMLTMLGRFEQAATLLTEAEELTEGQNDDTLTLTVLYYRGIVEIERGALRGAFEPLLKGQSLARKNPSHERRMWAFTDALGTLYMYTGQPERALECYEAGIVADRAYGDEHGLSRSLSNVANAHVALGRFDEGLKAATESDHYARRLDDRQILPLNDVVRGAVAVAKGSVDDAEKHLRSALEYAIADGTGANLGYIDLADVLIQQGELDEAATLLEAVFDEAPARSTIWMAARAVAAALALARGDLPLAGSLVTQTTADHKVSGFAWPRYATRLATVRDALEQ